MEIFSPMMFNFIKCFVTSIVILLLLFLFQIELPTESFNPYAYLTISGICGIAIGDTFYLNALQSLGARKTLLMETLAAPFTGLIAFIYFGTTISIFGWIGIATIIYGLYIVINEQKDETNSTSSIPNETASQYSKNVPLLQQEPNNQRNQQEHLTLQMRRVLEEVKQFIFNKGVLNAMAAMFCQSLGMVLSSAALQYGEINTLLATFIRLLAASFMLIPMLKFWKKETFTIPKLSVLETSQLLAVVLVSTLICIYFQQLSLVYTRPEISQTLLATSTIFGLVYGKFKGEHISKKQYFGSIIAFFGVGVIVWC
ncbi:hypothetical protein ABPG73_010709 [Tetrahymena malaccensis]